jgi:hypothetical protein
LIETPGKHQNAPAATAAARHSNRQTRGRATRCARRELDGAHPSRRNRAHDSRHHRRSPSPRVCHPVCDDDARRYRGFGHHHDPRPHAVTGAAAAAVPLSLLRRLLSLSSAGRSYTLLAEVRPRRRRAERLSFLQPRLGGKATKRSARVADGFRPLCARAELQGNKCSCVELKLSTLSPPFPTIMDR